MDLAWPVAADEPPVMDDPNAGLLRDFLSTTEPATVTAERWSQVLAAHAVEG